MSIQYIFELVGICFFAISGALAANDKAKQDWFGVSFIAFITAIGGGSLRDILLGSYPLVWIGNVNFMYAIFGGIVIANIFYKQLIGLRKTLFLFDTIGVAAFTILGTEKALAFGVHPVICAIMGMFTAVMGGVMRDTLTNEVPIIFQKEIYATACLAGAVVYLILDNVFDFNRSVCFIVSAACIFVIRIIVVKYKLSLPRFSRN